MKKLKVAIFGGSGYGGSELLRILLFHPHVDVVLVTANEHAGKTVAEVHRNVYGLTETNREAVRTARLIANPGCFATATLLGLAPLVANGLLAGRVVVDAKTGSSGSGAKAAANTHHPQRMNSFYAYKPFTHQHVPEIEQELAHVGDWTNELIFMTHSLPVARGIFASIYAEVNRALSAA